LAEWHRKWPFTCTCGAGGLAQCRLLCTTNGTTAERVGKPGPLLRRPARPAVGAGHDARPEADPTINHSNRRNTGSAPLLGKAHARKVPMIGFHRRKTQGESAAHNAAGFNSA
jgi:hypothetical protein